MSGDSNTSYYLRPTPRNREADYTNYGGYSYTPLSRNRNHRQTSSPHFRSVPFNIGQEYDEEAAHSPWQHPFIEERIITRPSRFSSYSRHPGHPISSLLPIPVIRHGGGLINQGSPPRYINQQTRTREEDRSSSSSVSHQPDQNTTLEKLRKEIYDPAAKKITRRLCSYYKDREKYMEKEKENDNEDDLKRCAVCLEDFEPKEVVMVTKCRHMFHEECIVPWLKSNGKCPVCRFELCDITRRNNVNVASGNNNMGNVGAEDLFAREIVSVIRAMEEAFIWGNGTN